MLPDLTREELAAALDTTAFGVINAAGISKPPVNAFRVAEALGIVVALDDRQAGRARYVRLAECPASRARGGQASILMRQEPRHERRQWAVAHELGEHLAAETYARLGRDLAELSDGGRETIANLLANRLLLPTAWLASAGSDCGWDLAALKAIFSTASHELLARRMLDFEPPVIVTVWDNARITFRRANRGNGAPPLLAAESDCWRAAHTSGRPQATASKLLVRGWPIHEPGWKREILRTEPAEDSEHW